MLRPNLNLTHEIRFLNQLKKLADSGKYFRLPSYRRDSLLKKLLRIIHKIKVNSFFDSLKPLVTSIILSLGYAGFNHLQAQSFAPPVINPFNLGQIPDVFMLGVVLVDIDGDAKCDLFVAGYYHSTIWFQKNIGIPDQPLFDTPILNPFGLDQTSFAQTTGEQYLSLAFADLDGDGDYDLIVTLKDTVSYEYNFIFIENIGNPTSPVFGTETINPYGLSSTPAADYCQPVLADIDHDGDLDLFVCTYHDPYTTDVLYYENTGNSDSAAFESPSTNPFSINPIGVAASSMGFADIDCDADLDILMSGYYSFFFFENTGTNNSPSFALPDSNIVGLNYYYSSPGDVFSICDLDNDGDPDILLGDYDSGNFVYFENLTGPCNVYVNDLLQGNNAVQIQPNPFAESATILFQNKNPVKKSFILYDTFAEKVRHITIEPNSSSFRLERDNLPAGTYFYQVHDDQSNQVIGSGKLIVQN